jgi:hypothetical protein
MQAFEAHEFNVIAERAARTTRSTWASVHHDVWNWGRSVLRARGTDAEQQRGSQRGTGQTFAIHLCFSSSLPRSCKENL